MPRMKVVLSYSRLCALIEQGVILRASDVDYIYVGCSKSLALEGRDPYGGSGTPTQVLRLAAEICQVTESMGRMATYHHMTKTRDMVDGLFDLCGMSAEVELRDGISPRDAIANAAREIGLEVL